LLDKKLADMSPEELALLEDHLIAMNAQQEDEESRQCLAN
jgi:hypothetical protein